MVTSSALSVLIGTLFFKCAATASIRYEPIKITVNENYNVQPGQVLQEMEPLEPGVVHQGSNFYIKPQLNLPSNYIPPHIEALLSLLQQHEHYCAKDTSKVLIEKDKVMEILKPFMYPLSDISKQTLAEEILTEPLPVPIIITEERKPVSTEILDIPEAPELAPLPHNIVEEVKKEILEDPADVINYVEPKPIISEVQVIPESPVLPPLQLRDVHVDKEGVEVKNQLFELPVIEAGPETVVSEIVDIPEAPILPPLSLSHDHVVEEVKIEEPVILTNLEKIVIDVEPKPTTPEVLVIPDAPVLPPLSFNTISPNVEEEVRREETIILKKPIEIFPVIPDISVSPIQEQIINYIESEPIISELEVIPEAPTLPPLSLSDVHIDKEQVKVEHPLIEPDVIEEELETTVPELVAIPEAPVLPPLTLTNIPSIVEEKVKKENSIILEKPTEVFPVMPEISVSPVQEQIIKYVEPKPIISELEVIPEAPAFPLPSLSDVYIDKEQVEVEQPLVEPVVIEVELETAVPELVALPEAPVLPPLTLINIPSIVEEKVKKEKSIILEEPTEVFPAIPKISVSPIQEQITDYVEPKPILSELDVILEAPALPSLSFGDVHIDEEEVEVEPFLEPVVIEVELETALPEIIDIPEAPILPPLSLSHDHVVEEVKIEEPVILPNPEKNVIDVESKPILTPDVLVIPDAPVLRPLSFDNMPPIDEEEVKEEESIILEEPMEVFPAISEISVSPVQEQIINNVEPKPVISELEVIPEAPALPLLSLSDVHIDKEKVEIEHPLVEPAVMEVELETAIPQLVAIPEAPVLPPLTLTDIPSVVEEKVKKDKSIILAEPTEVLSTISEITEQEPIIYVEPEPLVSELEVIQEAPGLPLLSQSNINVVEEVKIGNPILEPVVVIELNSTIPELMAIPNAPTLPPLSLIDVPSNVGGVENVKSIIFRKPSGVFPTIPEISVRPISEPFINYVEPRSTISEARIIEEPIEVFPLITKIASGVNLQEPEISNSYVLEEVSGSNPYTDVTVKETIAPYNYYKAFK